MQIMLVVTSSADYIKRGNYCKESKHSMLSMSIHMSSDKRFAVCSKGFVSINVSLC